MRIANILRQHNEFDEEQTNSDRACPMADA